MKITIGMAHHTDFNGVYFSIQDIIKELRFNNREDLLDRLEFLIVENQKENEHAKAVEGLKTSSGLGEKFRVINLDDSYGTSCTRNKIIQEANTEFVLVMDCHVFLCPVVDCLDKLFKFIDKYPNTKNLYQGPLVYDNMYNFATHFDDTWSGQMWGQWGLAWTCKCNNFLFSVRNKENKCHFVDLVSQREVKECNYCYSKLPDNLDFPSHETKLESLNFQRKVMDKKEDQFEIFSQGLGMFFTSKDHWLGFNEHCRGFGGEECYIHEKYRKNGRRAMCLPFLKWLHRFQRPDGVKYTLTLENKVRNYILEFVELRMDITPVYKHFVEENNFEEDKFKAFVQEAKSIYGI